MDEPNNDRQDGPVQRLVGPLWPEKNDLQREKFEAWIKVDTTLPVDRDVHGYADFTTDLMWHTWRAAVKANAPVGALEGESDAKARLGLAGEESACKHDFALQPSSGIQICQQCGLSTVAARVRPNAGYPTN